MGFRKDKLKNARKAKNWSFSKAAKLSGMRPANYKRIETGENKNPGIETILKIANAFSIPFKDLCQDQELKEIWAIINGKGGVGKTSAAFTLATLLSKELGYEVVLVDNDPQKSLTTLCLQRIWIDEQKNNAKSSLDIKSQFDTIQEQIQTHNIYSLMRGDSQLDECLINLDCLPFSFIGASEKYKEAPQFFQSKMGSEVRLKIQLSPIQCDFLILDGPGSYNEYNNWALAQATRVIIPVETDTLAVDPLSDMIQLVNDALEFSNPNLEHIHIIPNKMEETRICWMSMANINNRYRDYLLISEDTKLFDIKGPDTLPKDIMGINRLEIMKQFILGEHALPKKGRDSRVYDQFMSILSKLLN